VLAERTSKCLEKVLGVLNMLACEWVGEVTEMALTIKRRKIELSRSKTNTSVSTGPEDCPLSFAGRSGESVMNGPMVEPRHVRAAYERLQASKKSYNLAGTRLP